ncbi:MAG: beta galactosidase jelly roll domain-containing protein [Dysgonamonadaceae bacterium]|jgi:beta-glucuronidase|nr:beta galactosidase jelly roll domain-containing protein [Dysgonamonadaceae bacterium]
MKQSCKKTILLLLCAVTVFQLTAQNQKLYPQIINVNNRNLLSLEGSWKTIVDPFENGYYNYRLQPLKDGYFSDRDYTDRTRLQEYDFSKEQTLAVPGDWNTQRPQLYYYEGTVWYRKRFDFNPKAGERYFLYFGAVNYEAKIYLNGQLIGAHVGGFTPFNIEVTGKIKAGENSIVVKVDNKRKPEAVPTVNADWWNFGGITRQASLVTVPGLFIRDYKIQLAKGNAKLLQGWVQLDGAAGGEKVTIAIPELSIEKTIVANDAGLATVEIPLKKLTLWEPENPKLYDVTLSIQDDNITDRIGFRTIETRGTDILLNGKKIFCRGISIHEETADYSGRAYNENHAVTLLSWAKELGCNFVRLAHYPHNEFMVRTAERMGLMVWSEIPVYWTIHWENKDTYANAEAQLQDMITRDKNRANVVIWSVANETPVGEPRLHFLSKLIAKARSMDDARLVAAAMEKEEIRPGKLTVHDDLGELIDLVSFNQYVGWYDGEWDKCDRVNWSFDVKKPVFISEMGGDAQYGLHGKDTERFTEEYQEKLYERSIEMLKRMDGLAGVTPWILKDFRSPRRHLKDIQDDFNRKGLVSDKGQRKKAFYVLKKWYDEIDASSRK